MCETPLLHFKKKSNKMAKKKPNEIFISPVQRKSVQGRSDYSYVDSQGNIRSMDRSFAKGVAKRINFPASRDGSSIKTGLERLIDNPWYEIDLNDVPEHLNYGVSWSAKMPDIIKKPKISKQLELEIKFDLAENYLTNRKNLSHSFKRRDKDAKPNYLETFSALLYDRPNRFDDTTLRSALIMELAKVSNRIANSKKEVNPSRHHFYISQENEAAVERAIKDDFINDAITDLTLLRRNHDSFMSYQIAIVLGIVKSRVASAVVKDALNGFIKSKTKTQMQNIKDFNRIIDLLNEGIEGKNKLYIEYLLKQATNNNVISLKNGRHIWHSKKGIENIYDLGTKRDKVLKLFYDEFIKFDEDINAENWYGELVEELKTKGIKLEE